ncbi:MAG: hypothetical protein NVSMB60_08010 [Mycobacterium sp.]
MADGIVNIKDAANVTVPIDVAVMADLDERQIVVLGDPATDAGQAKVLNANPAGTEYALVARTIPIKGAAALPVAVSVTTTATLLIAANTARKVLMFTNNGTQTIYYGGTSGVTTTIGLPLVAGATLIDGDSSGTWYAIVTAGTADVRVQEIA